MNDKITKAILSGLGFASLTGDAIRETAQSLVKQSKLSEKEGRRLVKEFQQRSATVEKALAKKVDEAVRKALDACDVATSTPRAKSKNATAKRKSGGKRKAARKTKAK